MPINARYKAKYKFGAFYHVFNRTSANQLMFRDKGNYYFFLERFQRYLGKYLDVLSWCLIPNHFHFLVRIKEVHEMPPFSSDKDLNSVITRQFKNFFISYSISFKKMFDLSGNVFAQKYKHIRLYTSKDVRRLVLYIHRNPKHHKLGDWQNYRWSSYNEILLSNSTDSDLAFIISLFEDQAGYKKAHWEYVEQGSEP